MRFAVEHYKRLFSGALLRYFPRTSAYLRAEREARASQSTPKPQPKLSKPCSPARKPRSKAAGKSAAGAPNKASQAIYGPRLLNVGAAQRQAMQAQVAQAVAAGLIGAPSAEQWAMILARNPLTRIFAGAGSGKSSTLVLRVVFMLCHMGMEPSRLTVISFTNASCAELREQLTRLLGFFNYPFDALQARQCVRTFHSAMGAMAKELLHQPRWFEQLDDPPGARREPDNPLAAGRLRPAQRRLLEQAYRGCYAEQPSFRARVQRLLGLAPSTAGQGKAPMEAFQLKGEFGAQPLFEAFHSQAAFIQSLGLSIEQIQVEELGCSAQERCFVEALQQFQQYFEGCLREQGLLTYAMAFQALSTESGPLESAPKQLLAPLSHLLIDEFQDISPQIVQWLQAVQRALARQGEAVSLMAIGDDWQSIYAWRGSSPELFMNFDRHFPGKGQAARSAVLMLTNNYRSIDPIIRDGEALLDAVAVKQAKTSTACKLMQPGDHGVKLIQRFDIQARMPELLREIQAQCAHVASRSTHERTAVLLLSRRNAPLQALQAQLDKSLPVKAYTIHRAKGLQAEVAIILDESGPAQAHPLRNALYAYSGLFHNSYDQALQDENLRLAYVAVTRGVSRVLWYCQKTQGATRLLAQRGRP